MIKYLQILNASIFWKDAFDSMTIQDIYSLKYVSNLVSELLDVVGAKFEEPC